MLWEECWGFCDVASASSVQGLGFRVWKRRPLVVVLASSRVEKQGTRAAVASSCHARSRCGGTGIRKQTRFRSSTHCRRTACCGWTPRCAISGARCRLSAMIFPGLFWHVSGGKAQNPLSGAWKRLRRLRRNVKRKFRMPKKSATRNGHLCAGFRAQRAANSERRVPAAWSLRWMSVSVQSRFEVSQTAEPGQGFVCGVVLELSDMKRASSGKKPRCHFVSKGEDDVKLNATAVGDSAKP